MLDTPTKRRIDDCRNILVGKLPDPKAQIEQITIGLIYKFMDDMDKEAIELGGKSKFFSDYKIPDPEFPNNRKKDKVIEFSKYAWDKLMHPKVTAAEMLTFYSEAIEGMEKNPNIPQLFRDIFSNAYLPYRDPETLKLFLKTIGEFQYTHSEKLGDAFEYLLSVMGSQGDAGQFRTPRHIIDFIVAVIDPDKGDTIHDPACGTAGFLIAAYKHILLKHSKENKDLLNVYQYNQLRDEEKFPLTFNRLTPDERKKLIQNFVGYDISPDMVRLSLVNLYLHGFSTPNIHEYDTLSSEERWNESFDVILANPPFMSPKGGIRPHKKFTISSNRSEVLFVDYIAEHLNPNGKAGIIVPEGIIFQSGTAYKDLRKMLVENHLYAVVSLPAGVFNPYSGVKTSILLMDKEVAKKRDEILFIKIDNDGYNLGAQRTAIKGSQLEDAIQIAHDFTKSGSIKENPIAQLVPKIDIAKNGDFNLSGSRYLSSALLTTDFETVKLEDVLDYEQPTEYIVESEEYDDSYKTPVLTAGKSFILGYTNEEKGIFASPLPVIIFDDFTTATKFVDFPFKVKSSAMKILKAKENANITFLYYLMQHIQFDSSDHKRYWISQYSKIEIPLPPLSFQEEIVAEIEGYQKIINGAKAVVAHYKPKIDIDPDWEVVELGSVTKFSQGTQVDVGFQSKEFVEGYDRFLRIENYTQNSTDFRFIPKDMGKGKYVSKDDVVVVRYGATAGFIGRGFEGILANNLFKVEPDEILTKDYLFYYLSSEAIQNKFKRITAGGAMPALSFKTVEVIPISIPEIETQRLIVAQIEKEQELVNANKKLIEIFEQKIKDRIAKVWGE